MPNEWQTVLDEIKSRVTDMAYGAYFANLKLISLEDGKLTLAVQNPFVKASIDGKYKKALEESLKASGYKYDSISIIVSDIKRSPESPKTPEIVRPIGGGFVGVRPASPAGKNGLKAEFRMDNYVAGNNDLAVSAAWAVIENPGVRYNPLFIYGGSGLGKTHLIQAIGNEIVERNPKMRVLYTTIEQFYHEFVESMRKRLDGFTDKYRNVDVLIVDDFQFIEKKEKSQDEFFHTFNELHQHNKQIIVSSDRLPTQIATVDERLASRLMMGVPIDIQMPDFETRCAILHTKAEILNKPISDHVVEYLAQNVRTNIRDLEGKLHSLLLMSEVRGITPDELIDDGFIAATQDDIRHRNISPKQLVDKVAKYYNLNAKDLYGTSRVKDIKSARQVAMYLMKDQLGLSTVKIGNEFKKDHTTIMHGIKVIETSLKTDFNLRQQISDLREKFYAS